MTSFKGGLTATSNLESAGPHIGGPPIQGLPNNPSRYQQNVWSCDYKSNSSSELACHSSPLHGRIDDRTGEKIRLNQ